MIKSERQSDNLRNIKSAEKLVENPDMKSTQQEEQALFLTFKSLTDGFWREYAEKGSSTMKRE